MKEKVVVLGLLVSIWASCISAQAVLFQEEDIRVVNREIVSISDSGSELSLNNQKGAGMAVLNGASFEEGVIEVELKGENNPGKSFVGIAFNIQNDSTYEAVYFRPFNFQSDEPNRRAHSVQYIYHPNNGWKYLRTNHEGVYEAEFPRRPSPDDWFKVMLQIDEKKVMVYDLETNTEILSVERRTDQVSNMLGLWTGFDSKGSFRNLKIQE